MSNVLNLAEAVRDSEFLAIRSPREVADAPPEFQAVDSLLREAFYGGKPITQGEAASLLQDHLNGGEVKAVVHSLVYVDAWLKEQFYFFNWHTELSNNGLVANLQQGVNRLYCKHRCPCGAFDGNEDGINFIYDVAAYLAIEARRLDGHAKAARAVAKQVVTHLAYFNEVVLPLNFHTEPKALVEILAEVRSRGK